jgi:hypothetical protein
MQNLNSLKYLNLGHDFGSCLKDSLYARFTPRFLICFWLNSMIFAANNFLKSLLKIYCSALQVDLKTFLEHFFILFMLIYVY